MATATFSLENFRSEILGGSGLARTNRFEVIIANPPALAGNNMGQLSSLYVEQASIPLLNIFSKAFKIFGPSYQRPVTSEYGGEGISLTFHVDRDMQIRNYFEDWMHAVIDPVTFTVGYQRNYATTIAINQLNEQNQVTYSVELLEAFPRNLNIMELNNNAMNQTHRLNVLFAYRYWKNKDRNTTQIQPVPRVVANPQVPRNDVPVPETRRQWDWSTGTLKDGPGSDLPPAA